MVAPVVLPAQAAAAQAVLTTVVPGVPVLPAVLAVTADTVLAATAAGQPAIISSALGTALVLIGAPIYLFYRVKE